MKRQRITVGIRLNYGMQAWYRLHGIEPRCGICEHFCDTPVDVDRNLRICRKRGHLVGPADVCFSPERAAGADDLPEK
jgi:hypothetical protein